MKITVNDMSCNHCVAKIQKQLIMKGIKSEIKLADKIVEVVDQDQEQAMEAIKEAGYTPTI